MTNADFDTLRESNFRELADIYRDDVSADAMSLYFREGIIDSDELKKAIQNSIEISDKHYPAHTRILREFMNFVIRTGERGPQKDWN